MEISFRDKKLQELCEQESVAQRKLGKNTARKLKARLADLMAAANVSELQAGRPHPLKGDRVGQFALDLVHPQRLVFKPAHETIPRLEDGGIDWSQVTQIYIIWIGDYHD
ncbi:MAG TPA: killer suppression protein HigA [Oscillatoriaceae cyanobacterium M33_DOE_052]|uniref:Killer suppression protein HigA n=1 Tax=Planktothricoides sp. SpSt-374 TaxID=2282167 RepID=A0A7C3VU68_9CYAN|nr:killer suppression protein HigA [Oscillatoriaceae cyanobacterium M33_DOE_052]